jgi:hypothetical protein
MNTQPKLSYSQTLPRHYICPLSWLGKNNWITATASGYRWSQSHLRQLEDRSIHFGSSFAQAVSEILYIARSILASKSPHTAEVLDRFFTASNLLAKGQKTLRLSHEWCVKFENASAGVTFETYRQPYETMAVELPNEYAKAREESHSTTTPRHIVVHNNLNERILIIQVVFQDFVIHLRCVYRDNERIEEFLERTGELQEVWHADLSGLTVNHSHIVGYYRIALNAMLAMTNGISYHSAATSRADQISRNKLKRVASSKDRSESRNAALRAATFPEYFHFDQNINAFSANNEVSGGPHTQTGTPKKSHWRRGYWRKQAIGEGWSQHRLIFIPPVFINAKHFHGDLEDTSTTYTS